MAIQTNAYPEGTSTKSEMICFTFATLKNILMNPEVVKPADETSGHLKDLIYAFEHKRPEIVFEWKDTETEAEGWVVINSLRGGSAGGGTRMRKGLDKHEVESLAKTMEIKFSVSGPPIGGAKSGINFDPFDPRKKGVLERWFKAVIPLLRNYYGTGGDLNVDEIHEVIPITEKLGLHHPQQGTAKGHFKASEEKTGEIIGRLRLGVKKVLEDPAFSPDITRKITVADMITGYGVAKSVEHYYKLYSGNIQGKRAVIQGWGNVGAAAGFYLAKMGVKITGIIDKKVGLINKEGYSFEEVRQLYLDRSGNQLSAPGLIPFDSIKQNIWKTDAEIFIPAASSRLIDQEHLDQLLHHGLEVIACGANVPFADREIFFGPISEFADQNVSVIPDFISNCGMARVFAFLMSDEAVISDHAIFDDVSDCIERAMIEVKNRNPKKIHLAETAMEIALEKLI